MRPILLIMWRAFQSFILRDNNVIIFINRSSSNQKQNLFLATKRLWKRDHGVPFPRFKVANQEESFFDLLRRLKRFMLA